jgi:phosphoribosyl 1,2-cyclic phosphodiesterase
MRLWMLGSGSRGNSVVLESMGQRLLVDAGFGPRILTSRLRQAGIAPESIQGVLVTHEHWDHVRGLPSLVKKWKWTVSATQGTIDGFPALGTIGATVIPGVGSFSMGAFAVEVMSTSHDAGEPVGFVITSAHSGCRVGIATDLGRATSNVRKALSSLDVLVLESNHDDDMLRYGPYPPMLKRRIASDRGHLSNNEAAHLAGACVHASLRQIVLAHLSETNNTPACALNAFRPVLKKTRFAGRVQVAPQDAVIGPIEPVVTRASQLSLGM